MHGPIITWIHAVYQSASCGLFEPIMRCIFLNNPVWSRTTAEFKRLLSSYKLRLCTTFLFFWVKRTVNLTQALLTMLRDKSMIINGRMNSTKDRLPMRLICYEACLDEGDTAPCGWLLLQSSWLDILFSGWMFFIKASFTGVFSCRWRNGLLLFLGGYIPFDVLVLILLFRFE